MSNFEDGAQAVICATATRPSLAEIQDAFGYLFRKAGPDPDVQMALAAAIGACTTAMSKGVDPLELAEALAGGGDKAAGRLLEHRLLLGYNEEIGFFDQAIYDMHGAMQPGVLEHLGWGKYS